jgi:SAM-dependent methyltransferase
MGTTERRLLVDQQDSNTSRERRDALYALGYSDEEQRRLIEQDSIYGPVTTRLLQDAGIGRGARALDVGCGVGDVSLRVAELVGPTGAVLGVDTDAQALETARARAAAVGHTQARFFQADLRALPGDEIFDVVVGRLILMYLGEPSDALRRLSRRVRPGGIIAFHEIAFHMPPRTPRLPVVEQCLAWIFETLERAGIDLDIGLKLPRIFEEAGLPAPALRVDTLVMTGPESPMYQFLANTIRSLLPNMQRLGVATLEEVGLETLAARLREEVLTAQGLSLWPPLIGAWTRMPGE